MELVDQIDFEMKIRKGFVLREICGVKVVSGEGLDKVNYSKLITLNDTAAYLWEAIGEGEFSADSLTALLLEKYDVSEDTARKDVEALIGKWNELGMIEE